MCRRRQGRGPSCHGTHRMPSILTASIILALTFAAPSGAGCATFKGIGLSGANSYTCASFSPRGTMVVAGTWRGALVVFDVATGVPLRKVAGQTARAVRQVTWSPDGARIASVSSSGTALVFASGSGKLVCSLRGYAGAVRAVSFSSNGKLIVSASDDQTVRIWDVRSGKQIRCLRGHKDRVTYAEFSPDSKTIVSSSYDGTLRLWRASDGELLSTYVEHRARFNHAAFTRDASRIVAESNLGHVIVIRTSDRKLTLTLRSDGQGSATSPDGSLLALGSLRGVEQIRCADAELIYCASPELGVINGPRFSNDSQLLLATSGDGQVLVWRAKSGVLVNRMGEKTSQLPKRGSSRIRRLEPG